MSSLFCFGSRRRLANATPSPAQPVPHHTRTHSAGPLTLNPVIVSQKDSPSVGSSATLDPEDTEAPSIVPTSSNPSTLPATLSDLLDGEDDVKSIAKSKKPRGTLRRVTSRIRRRFSRDSMRHQAPQAPRQTNPELLDYRSEVKNRHHRMIVQELLQEKAERKQVGLCLSELDAALAAVADDQRAGRLEVACRPRDNLEFAVTTPSEQRLQQARKEFPSGMFVLTNNTADPNYPAVAYDPAATAPVASTSPAADGIRTTTTSTTAIYNPSGSAFSSAADNTSNSTTTPLQPLVPPIAPAAPPSTSAGCPNPNSTDPNTTDPNQQRPSSPPRLQTPVRSPAPFSLDFANLDLFCAGYGRGGGGGSAGDRKRAGRGMPDQWHVMLMSPSDGEGEGGKVGVMTVSPWGLSEGEGEEEGEGVTVSPLVLSEGEGEVVAVGQEQGQGKGQEQQQGHGEVRLGGNSEVVEDEEEEEEEEEEVMLMVGEGGKAKVVGTTMWSPAMGLGTTWSDARLGSSWEFLEEPGCESEVSTGSGPDSGVGVGLGSAMGSRLTSGSEWGVEREETRKEGERDGMRKKREGRLLPAEAVINEDKGIVCVVTEVLIEEEEEKKGSSS